MMGDLDKRQVVLFIVAAFAVVAALFAFSRQTPPANPQAQAVTEAQQDVQRMYEEDLAAAKAQAELNAQLRQAEMDAADNILNLMTSEPDVADPLALDAAPPPPPPAAEAPADTPGQSDVLSRGVYVRGTPKGESGRQEAP